MTTPDSHYDDLAALYINCTLKPSPQLSHTQGLVEPSAGIMRRHGVQVEVSAPSTTTSPPACGRT